MAALKREDGKDLVAIGSTELVQTPIAHDLVDEFRLMIDPVVLGGGKRVFRDDGLLKALRLVSSEVTTTGAILARSDLDQERKRITTRGIDEALGLRHIVHLYLPSRLSE